jgi:carboxylesterase
MGGSLTLRLAEQHGSEISGIVLVNPAVHSERADRHLLPIVSRLLKSFPGVSNDIAKPGQDEVAYKRLPLKAASSLAQLWKIVKSDISKVNQPVLLFRSLQDHVVEASNAQWILDHISSTDKEEILLENSFHVATLDYDAELIETASADFIKRLIND